MSTRPGCAAHAPHGSLLLQQGPCPALSCLSAWQEPGTRLAATLWYRLPHVVHVQVVDMAQNYFTGTLPSRAGSTEILSRLMLQSNQLHGPLATLFRSFDVMVSLPLCPPSHLSTQHRHQAQCWRDEGGFWTFRVPPQAVPQARHAQFCRLQPWGAGHQSGEQSVDWDNPGCMESLISFEIPTAGIQQSQVLRLHEHCLPVMYAALCAFQPHILLHVCYLQLLHL